MANAERDQNHVTTGLASLDTSPSETSLLAADETTHRLQVTEGGTNGTENSAIANRDQNHRPVFMAVSRDDGVTPVAIYATSDGKLLI